MGKIKGDMAICKWSKDIDDRIAVLEERLNINLLAGIQRTEARIEVFLKDKGEEVTKVCDDWKKDTLDKAYDHEKRAAALQKNITEHNELMLMYAKNISELMAKLADHLKDH